MALLQEDPIDPIELVGYSLMRSAHVVDDRVGDAAAIQTLAWILENIDMLDQESLRKLRRGAGESMLDHEHDRLTELRQASLEILCYRDDERIERDEVNETAISTVKEAREWIHKDRRNRKEAGESPLLYAVADTRISGQLETLWPVADTPISGQLESILLEVDREGVETVHPLIDTSGFAL